LINLYSFHSFIYSNQSKEKVLCKPYLGVAVVAEEEAAIYSGGGTGGDRR
jgi:hypothetical protein